MKIRTICRECPKRYIDELPLLELQDQDLYKFTCEHGHENLMWLQNEKYDILFQSACLAILDGNPREAAFNLAASLERFLEFTVHVLSLPHGISTDEFSATWKDVGRQSERQLGMFLCMWLIHTRQAPKLIGGDWVKFRNDVVHAGLIPSETDVIRSRP